MLPRHHPVSPGRRSVFSLVAGAFALDLELLGISVVLGLLSGPARAGQPQVSREGLLRGGELGRRLSWLNFMARTTCHTT